MLSWQGHLVWGSKMVSWQSHLVWVLNGEFGKVT